MTKWLVGRRFRRLSVALGLGMVLLILTAGRPDPTEASWQDTEFAQASFSAKVIPPVVIDTCALTGVLGLLPVARVTWHFPQPTLYTATANASYYTAKDNNLTLLENVTLGPDLTTSGPVNNIYTTEFKSGLLSGLLGGTYGVFIATTEAGWTSALAGGVASLSLLGLNPKCVVVQA